MGKGSKIIGTLFLILGIACIGMYFFIGDQFTNYKVVFDSDGGTIVADQVIKIGEKASKPADPIKENNEFIEWRLDGVAYNFDNVVPSDITLKAAWNQIINHNVKVTLEEKDYTVTIRDGQVVTLESLNIPSKEGFTIKFYKSENEEYDLTKPVTEDLDLIAKYVEIKTYTIKFNSNGGTKVEDIKVVENQTVTEPTTTRDGYIFDGWYLAEAKYNFSNPVTSDINLIARWNDGPKVNVTFMVDEKVYKTIAVKENTTVTKPSNPTKSGYRFVEWQFNGKAFDFKTKITSELVLTAVFEEVTSFKVTFNSDGGSSVKAQEVTSKVTKPNNPTKSGYKFIEWQLDGKTFDFNQVITSDITLKAIWEKEKAKYTVRFNDDNDKEITTQTVEEGNKATRPSNPTKDGYRFVDWLYNHEPFNFDTPISQSIVLTARFERITTNPDVNTPDVTEDDK